MPTENRNLKNHARTIQYTKGIPYTAARRIAEAIHATGTEPVQYPKNPRVLDAQIPVGLDNDNLMPVWDISREGHLIVRGLTGAGVTSTLRTIISGINRRKHIADLWVIGHEKEMADMKGISRYAALSSTDYNEVSNMLKDLVGVINRRVMGEEDSSLPIVLIADYRLRTASDANLMAHILNSGPKANVHVALGMHHAEARYVDSYISKDVVQATVWLPTNLDRGQGASSLVHSLPRSKSRHAVWAEDGEERIFRVFVDPSR